MSEMKNECKELSSVNGYVSFADHQPRESMIQVTERIKSYQYIGNFFKNMAMR